MKKKANTGEVARARREKGRVRDALGDQVEVPGGIGLIHLGGAVGLRVGVALGQREITENILKDAGILVPYTIREMSTPHKQED